MQTETSAGPDYSNCDLYLIYFTADSRSRIHHDVRGKIKIKVVRTHRQCILCRADIHRSSARNFNFYSFGDLENRLLRVFSSDVRQYETSSFLSERGDLPSRRSQPRYTSPSASTSNRQLATHLLADEKRERESRCASLVRA